MLECIEFAVSMTGRINYVFQVETDCYNSLHEPIDLGTLVDHLHGGDLLGIQAYVHVLMLDKEE